METTTTDDGIDVAALGAWRPGAEAAHAVPPKLPEGSVAPVPAAVIAPVKPRKGARSALVWGSVGFMAGAVFWQLVGFGDFASKVVAGGMHDPGAEFALAEAPTASSFPKPVDMPVATTAPETAALPAQTPESTMAKPEAAASQTSPVAEVPAAPATGPALAAASEAPAPNPQTVYMVDPTNCTALELDRPAKRTLVRPCPDGGLALRLESAGRREDMAGLAAKLEPARYSRE